MVGRLVSVWMASLTTPGWPEFAAAGVTAGVCVPIAARARRALDTRPAVRPAWLRGRWRLPGAVLRDTVAVWLAAARRLRGAPVRGEMRELPFGGDRSAARQAVAVLSLRRPHRLHSGHVGDYAAALVVGAAAFTGAMVLA